MLKNGGHWFFTSNSNIGFDFLLTKFQRNSPLSLYFIDASTGENDQIQKI